MTSLSIKRRRTITFSLMLVLTLTVVGAPAGYGFIVGALVNFVDVTERIVRLPCWIVNPYRRLSLDRLDPTCPQCF